LKRIFAKENFKNSFSQLVISILPITASMHLLKALLKTTSRIPYWKFVFNNPEGVKTARSIIDNPEILNKSVLSVISPYIGIIAVLLSAGGIVLSLLIIRKQQHKNRISKLISVVAALIYSGIFLVTLIAWRMF